MSAEALQTSMKRRKVKGKGERERYTQLNTEFQDRTRDLFKKIGDIKGTFHERMGIIKDRNGKDLTEAKGKGERKTIYN